MLIGCFFWAAIVGACVIFGAIPTWTVLPYCLIMKEVSIFSFHKVNVCMLMQVCPLFYQQVKHWLGISCIFSVTSFCWGWYCQDVLTDLQCKHSLKYYCLMFMVKWMNWFILFHWSTLSTIHIIGLRRHYLDAVENERVGLFAVSVRYIHSCELEAWLCDQLRTCWSIVWSLP